MSRVRLGRAWEYAQGVAAVSSDQDLPAEWFDAATSDPEDAERAAYYENASREQARLMQRIMSQRGGSDYAG